MNNLKVFWYCVKSGRSLFRYSYEYQKTVTDYTEEEYEGECIDIDLDPKLHYDTWPFKLTKGFALFNACEEGGIGIERVFNGTVCFQSHIDKVEKINETETSLFSENGAEVYKGHSFSTSRTTSKDLLKRSCVETTDMDAYKPKYALYIKETKEITQFAINEFAKNINNVFYRNCLIVPLRRAPQNMEMVWWWNGKLWEHVLLISIRSNNLKNLANGLKDIELRNVLVKQINPFRKEK